MDRDPILGDDFRQSHIQECTVDGHDAGPATKPPRDANAADQELNARNEAASEAGEASPIGEAEPGDTEAEEASGGPSPLALVLAGRRRRFLQQLAREDLPVDLRQAVELAADSLLDEITAANEIVRAAAEDPGRPDAIEVCGAVAARIIARSLQYSLGPLDPMEAETLLRAVRDASRDISAARGQEGLRLLPPLAALLARHAVAHGETVAGVAAVIRRIATRIADDPKLGRGLDQIPFAEHRLRGMPGPQSRFVLHGPVEIARNAH